MLEPGTLEEADLVVGFEPFHVAAAVVTGAAVTSRAFLLTELADVLVGSTRSGTQVSTRLAERVASADARRRSSPDLPRPLPDPVGRPDRWFVELYREIDGLVAVVAGGLFSTGIRRTG